MALRQILAKQVQLLQGDLSQKQRFKDLFTAITMFLAEAEKTLGEDDLPSSSDEQALQDRYEEIKYLTLQFSNNMPQLDALNDLGYRMALSEESSLELRQLNHMFQRLYSETKEQNKMLQGIILVQQDFTEKCDAWMTFLAQTEQDLSTEIAGNLADLIDQQRKCEVRVTCTDSNCLKILHVFFNKYKIPYYMYLSKLFPVYLDMLCCPYFSLSICVSIPNLIILVLHCSCV